MTKKRKDLVAFLREEAAACEDLARVHVRLGKPKKDVMAFEKKAAMLTAAANELEAG